MLSGTRQRCWPRGSTVMCRRSGVSGVARTPSSAKLGPYCGCCSLLRATTELSDRSSVFRTVSACTQHRLLPWPRALSPRSAKHRSTILGCHPRQPPNAAPAMDNAPPSPRPAPTCSAGCFQALAAVGDPCFSCLQACRTAALQRAELWHPACAQPGNTHRAQAAAAQAQLTCHTR
jgi:hypothetical protein